MLMHYIHMRDSLPVRSPPHSISAVKLQGVRAEVSELLKLGIIVPSHSRGLPLLCLLLNLTGVFGSVLTLGN